MQDSEEVREATGRRAGELFQLFRDGRPRTRAQLSVLTGLSRSTIVSRVGDLLDLGLLATVGDAVSSGGRPPSQIALNPRAGVVLGADLGASHGTIALTDLAGDILTRRSEPVAIDTGPAEVLGWLAAVCRSMLTELGRQESDLLGIGIGVPGPVEFPAGRPSNPPIMPGWDGFDIPAWVGREFDVPVLVDNDVNLMALGERAANPRARENLLFVKIGTGIGAGVIAGGRLQRGAQGTAGDIGHISIARASDIECRCGNTGCLEAIASGPAIASALRASGVEVRTGHDVVSLATRGSIPAAQAVRQAGRDIGEVLAGCVSLMNPSLIAVGGSLASAGEHLLAGIREVVYARALPLASEHLTISQSRAGDEAAVLGASSLAIDELLSPRRIDEMLAV
ncbi:ROK family protein [Leifsonia sp. NPDC102414]|uniref:ROK family protein n=1 Tax=Leifsonia sp. NPDC102414 TaxID=3364124 RepID=UPI00380C73CC